MGTPPSIVNPPTRSLSSRSTATTNMMTLSMLYTLMRHEERWCYQPHLYLASVLIRTLWVSLSLKKIKTICLTSVMQKANRTYSCLLQCVDAGVLWSYMEKKTENQEETRPWRVTYLYQELNSDCSTGKHGFHPLAIQLKFNISLINTFVVHCQDRMIPLVYISEISRF